MNNKHIIFFLLLVLIAPIFISFYVHLEKERNRKKVVFSLISEEEESEKGEESGEKQMEKWGKGKCHIVNASLPIQSLNKSTNKYFHFVCKVLLPVTDSITPPPKIS